MSMELTIIKNYRYIFIKRTTGGCNLLAINNNAFRLKREILVRIARLQLAGNLAGGVHAIPRELAPKVAEPVRCCVYHDREMLRQRVISRLGHSLEDYDDEKKLSEYAEEALERERPTRPMLTVLDDACNACVRTSFMVTNACQACVARPCMMNCGKKAITIQNGQAHIDGGKCVNCGICLSHCPYHAIIKIPVPCEESCPVGAIRKNDTGRECIDYDKCIFCGNCMRGCPFGAVMDKSQLVDVLKHIINKKQVVALYAPAIAVQFRAGHGQLEGALEGAFYEAGFSGVVEVALGADRTADKEAAEFSERMSHGEKLMTTACCPAYVHAVRRHVPSLVPCMSKTRSPMHYTAEMAKSEFPDCITVFIGPCLAKREEGMDDDFVDYVLSAEELAAIFTAKGIDAAKAVPRLPDKTATKSGRGFAKSGGVAAAVRTRLPETAMLRETVINGLDKEGMKKLAEFGRIQSGEAAPAAGAPNLVEVMSCPGGCIAGPSVIVNPKTAEKLLEK
jgi:[FeFe] hydrogenase (group B1/B3)